MTMESIKKCPWYKSHNWCFVQYIQKKYYLGPFDPHPEERITKLEEWVCALCGCKKYSPVVYSEIF